MDNNYAGLSHFYVHNILQSRILVDEDLDTVLGHYHLGAEFWQKPTSSVIKNVCAGISIISSVALGRFKCGTLSVIISASPFLAVLYQTVRQKLYLKSRKANIESLLECIQNIGKLNREIYDYFTKKCNPKHGDMENYNVPLQDLIKTELGEMGKVLIAFVDFITECGKFVPLLLNDYSYIKSLDFELFNPTNITSLEECVHCLQNLNDHYVLLASNCLTSLALILCPELCPDMTNKKRGEIFDKMVPALKSISEGCLKTVGKKFDHIKYFHLHKNKLFQLVVAHREADTTSKLYVKTIKVVEHSAEVMKHTEVIFDKLQKGAAFTVAEKEALMEYIGILRNEVFEFYESLDILHKLYEVDLNRSRQLIPKKETPSESFSVEVLPAESESSLMDASLFSVEPVADEEYEVYVKGDESPLENNADCYDYQDSQIAQLLSQELKQKLKDHARFVAARKRRGSVIDEAPSAVQIIEVNELPLIDAPEIAEKEVKQVPPKPAQVQPFVPYPLPPLPPIRIPHPLPNCNDFNQRNTVPPPPPPPLPPIDSGPYRDEDHLESSYNVNHFLESIRVISTQRHMDEEVFGYSDDEEES